MSGFFSRNIGPLAAASLVALISDRWVAPSVVIGRSMYPTLNKGGSEVFFPDIIAVTRYDRFDVKTGDIVCFRSPVDPSRVLVKRIVAREGEWVAVNLGGFFARFKVPPGKLWVEGDNRDHSLDSRRFGAIPVGLILGRAKCVIWPPQNIKLLKPDLDIVNTTRISVPPSYAEQSLHRSQLQQQSHVEKPEQHQVIRQTPMSDAPSQGAVFEGDHRNIEIGPINGGGETSEPHISNSTPREEKSQVNYQDKFQIQEHANGNISSQTTLEANSTEEKRQKAGHDTIPPHNAIRSPPIRQEVLTHDHEMSQIKKRRELQKQRDLEVKEMVLEAERRISNQLNDPKDRK